MKITIFFILSVVAFVFAENEGKIRYDGYKVFRITPQNEDQLKALQRLEDLGINFWKEPSRVGNAVDVLLSPSPESQIILKSLEADYGFQVEIFVENVQGLIDETNTQMGTRSNRLGWDNYYTLDEIYTFLDEQASIHNLTTSTFSIGKTTEGRDLKVLKISKSGETKPAIWVDSNIHAREWLTSAIATYLIDQLLNSPDPEIEKWTEDFDFYFLVIVNPDGFERTHTTDRMWRKTLSVHPNSSCLGADANRNFGFHWLEDGTSLNPCSETFAGVQAFSEPETAAIRDFLGELGDRLVFYLTLHTYGQQIVFPFGYTHDHIPAYDTLFELTKNAAQAHESRYGTEFSYGISSGLYSGFSIDYAYGVLNSSLAILYELRDTGSYGFLVPADQIVPSSQEFLDGFPFYIEALRNGDLTRVGGV